MQTDATESAVGTTLMPENRTYNSGWNRDLATECRVEERFRMAIDPNAAKRGELSDSTGGASPSCHHKERRGDGDPSTSACFSRGMDQIDSADTVVMTAQWTSKSRALGLLEPSILDTTRPSLQASETRMLAETRRHRYAYSESISSAKRRAFLREAAITPRPLSRDGVVNDVRDDAICPRRCYIIDFGFGTMDIDLVILTAVTGQ